MCRPRVASRRSTTCARCSGSAQPGRSWARRFGSNVSAWKKRSMPAARIIPCLDVRDGRVVKGIQFRDHRDIGDIVEHALRYRDEGADELVFYDITASAEGRSLDVAWVRRIAAVIDIPFAVAGGIRSRDEAAACLDAGADKISINSPAIENPALIETLARDFGSQCVVLGVDTYAEAGDYWVKQYTGKVEAT